MINKIAYYLVAILLVLLPFHAFGWTWFHSFFWQEGWTIIIQAWKEILVGLLALLAISRLPSLPKANWLKLKTPANLFALIFVLLAVLYAVFGSGELSQRVFGLRTATLFLIAFLSVQLFDWSPSMLKSLIKITLGSATAVVVFGILQKTLLPPDFLSNFGYSLNVSSWLPGGNLPMYHLIGETDIIRSQSTFAGPNQLGAYLLVVLPLAVMNWWHARRDYLAILVALGSLPLLFLTFSRAAWVGLFGILLALTVHQWRRHLNPKLKQKLLLGGIIGGIALISLAFFQTNFQEIITRQASTAEHLTRNLAAAELTLESPLGLGLGATAGVSQRFTTDANNLTPENTYLGIALELGWLGGLLFLGFLFTLAAELNSRKSPLFYSLIGIITIALFLHPLEDSPTALTLFLLAGLTLARVEEKTAGN